MPFRQVDVQEEIIKSIKTEEDKREFRVAQLQLQIIKKCIAKREEMGLTQGDVAEKSGMTQQIVSRIETFGNKPLLRNFMRYLYALNLEIDLVKREQDV